MMVACLLSDKESFNDIRRSLLSFGNPESFLTRSDLMAKPTLYSCRLFSPHFCVLS